MKILETMTYQTEFTVEVLDRDTTSSEEICTMTFNYHLTHNKLRREIVPSHGYNYADLGCYALYVAELLEN